MKRLGICGGYGVPVGRVGFDCPAKHRIIAGSWQDRREWTSARLRVSISAALPARSKGMERDAIVLSGMMAASAGIVLSVQLAVLPHPRLLAAWLPLLIPLFADHRRASRLCACFLGGLAWGALQGQSSVERMLPVALEGRDLSVELCIEGLPVRRSGVGGETWRFRGRLLKAPAQATGWEGRRIELGFYGPGEFRPGQAWLFTVRLKAPRGMLNPGGRDYQAWLLAEGVEATGYVRHKAPRQRLPDHLCPLRFDQLRDSIRERLLALFGDEPQLGKLLAITLGDKSRIGPAEWRGFANTGTTHLMVISGLHVSLVGLLFLQLGSLLARVLLFPLDRWPARKAGAFLAVPAVLAYAALAGFSVATRRALVMGVVAMACVLLERRPRPWAAFAAALFAVLATDPLSATQTGFWLSFLAVAGLILGLSGRLGASGRLSAAWTSQWVVFVALMCPLAFAGQPFAVWAPLVNMLAVPLVSMVVVPLALGGTLLLALGDSVAVPLLRASLYALGWLSTLLQHAGNGVNASPITVGEPSGPKLVCAALATALLLAPRGFPARALGVVLLMPLLAPSDARREQLLLEVVLLDVGQGTAAIVRTRAHTLVYDAGPWFSERFDAGRNIVAPALRSMGVRRVDHLMLSHGDTDHSGGAGGLAELVPIGQVSSGDAPPPELRDGAARCARGQQWRWDGVEFRVLSPESGDMAEGNNRSCVLRVEAKGTVFLFPGDVEETVEARLVASAGSLLSADVVVVPHHGSRTSSSAAFVAAVRPRFALVSAAYRSRFGHPHAVVVARYRTHGAEVINTADSGAIRLQVDADGVLRAPISWREHRRRYWFR